MKREFQLAFLRRAELSPADYLLDLGCGTLRGGIPLIDYLEPGHYYGVEVRADVLDEGRAELREHGLEHKEPTLIAAPSLAELDLGRTFDVIWAFSVLIHMSDERLEDCLRLVQSHLNGGRLYANVNIGERPEESWQGFPVVGRSLSFYEKAADRHSLNVMDMGPIGSLGHDSGTGQDAQRMLQFRRAPATSRAGSGSG